ncbi:MAG TPA: ABC transporter ATP-binding protein, partial [Candidatus Eisenbacteria bacterium]|nr:ABC transporter ATP-binding protein [Candidatus Eisenbacteria bacterium]
SNFPPIYARGLIKRYGELVAVAGIDLDARAGSCLGLLGPNGAGKTTTIEVLEGLLPPNQGEVRVLGHTWKENGPEIRERIGVQLQETRLPDKLTPFETLRLFRSFYTRGRTPDEVLEIVGLTEKRNVRSVNMSGGQRQRLALGCALISRPEVLFLDEPTTGLDPQGRRRVWEIVEEFQKEGGTVLLTTHYMDEAERLADDLVILDHGKVIASGSPRSIIQSLGAEGIISFALADGVDSLDYSGLPGVLSVRSDTDRVELTVRESHETVPALLDFLRARNLRLAHLNTHPPTLEDVFVSLTGRHLRDD